MVFDSKQFLRDGSTDLTASQTSPAASGANKGPIALMTGLPRKGMWLKAYVKTQVVGTTAVNKLHATASPTGGTFTLTLGGQTTSSLLFNATAAQIKAAIIALTNVYLNGRTYASLGTADVTVSGTFDAGDVTITYTVGGVLASQPVVIALNSDVATTLTGGNTYVVQSTTAGMDIAIVGTDGTNALQSSGTIHINGATLPFQEMAVLIEGGQSFNVTGGQPLTSFNYNATVAGTPTTAKVVIVLDETMGGMN